MLFVLFNGSLAAQPPMEVTPGNQLPFTPVNLITNVFLGDGVEILDVTFDGDPVAVGYFNNAFPYIGINRGVVMTTGNVSNPDPSGVAGVGSQFASTNNSSTATDEQLLAVMGGGNVFNLAKYTIKFIPFADTIRFNYVFASEEYPEYACTNFNDAFGFFISGPGISGWQNIALVPGTSTPVTINNVPPSSGTGTGQPCIFANSIYYNSNNGSNTQPIFDGFTDVFVAQAVVIPCSTYTIKLVIADKGDGIFDTGVFLEAKSFGTPKIDVQLATASLDGTVVEGCTNGTIKFLLPSKQTTAIPVDYTIIGTATNGVDYEQIPLSAVFMPGDTVIEFSIVGIEDNIVEGDEFIGLDVQVTPCRRDTFWIPLRENKLTAPNLPDVALICSGQNLQLNATINVPTPPAPFFTSSPNAAILPVNTTISHNMNVFGVLPTVLGPDVLDEVCLQVSGNYVDDVAAYIQAPNGQFTELFSSIGNNSNNINACFSTDATVPVYSVTQAVIAAYPPVGNVPAADNSLYFGGLFKPEGDLSDLYGAPSNGIWKLLVRDKQQGFAHTLVSWQLKFKPLYQVFYAWSPAAGLSCTNCPNPVASPTATTKYFVTISDSYGCALVDSVHVFVGASTGALNPICETVLDDQITISWSDSPVISGYVLSVNGGPGNPLPAGTSSFTVSGLGLNQTVNFSLQAVTSCGTLTDVVACSTPSCLLPQTEIATQTNVTCHGLSNGSVVIQNNIPAMPLTYTINSNPVQSNATGIFTSLPAGTYSVTAINAEGCTKTHVVTIQQPTQILATTAVLQNVSCNGGANGSAQVTPTGGSGGYSYVWSNGSNSQLALGLSLGTYTVTVTDQNGCQATSTVLIQQASPLTVSLTVNNSSCSGSANASIISNVQNGSPTYTYLWSNGNVTKDAMNITAGTYTVTVTDNNGCTTTASATVVDPTPINLSINTTATTCGNNNGTATVVAAGGTGNFTYVWNNGQTDNTATGLAPGTYTVTVNSNGCTASVSAVVDAIPGIAATSTTTNASCFGGSNGSITVSVTQGSAPFTYQWSVPGLGNINNPTNLPPGTYTVTVSDDNNCTTVLTNSIEVPTQLMTTLTQIPATCFNINTGSIAMTTSGGTPPYQWSWTGPNGFASFDEDNTELYAGIYLVTVTDNAGCTKTGSIQVNQPQPLTVTTSSTPVACFGGSNGSVSGTASGGTPSYTFTWTTPNGSTLIGSSLTGQPAGNYMVTVSDANSCTTVSAVVVNQPAQALTMNAVLPDTVCFGATNGQLSASASGGTTPYSFLWSNGQTGTSVLNLASGVYTVSVTDANGCTASVTGVVATKPQIAASLSQTPALCTNTPTGSAAVDAVTYGGQPASVNSFSYTWSTNPIQTNPVAINLTGGQTFTVTITDNLGCFAISSIAIGNPAPISVMIDSVLNISCFEGNDGKAWATAFGGTTPYTYTWSINAGSQTGPSAINLSAGVYAVTASDANGCVAVASATLTQPSLLVCSTTGTNIKCKNASTGTASVTATGGTLPYTYNWTNGANTPNVDGLVAGTYVVTVIDAKNCTTHSSVTLTEPATALVAAATSEDATCANGLDGSISLFVEGGTPPYFTSINGVDYGGAFTIPGLSAGTYTAYISDFYGCTTFVPGIVISQPLPMFVELGPDTSITLGNSIQLLPEVINSQGVLSFSWASDNANDSLICVGANCSTVLITPSVQSVYYVTVTDANGCTAEDYLIVIIGSSYNIAVPTAFSPSGDPMNRMLIVHGESGAKVLSFRVFDRWGNIVYEKTNFSTNDMSAGWDGTWRGEPLNAGEYVWMLEARFNNGLRKFFKGSTVLLR